MMSIQKTSREMMTRARLREASGRAFDRAAELARMFLSFVILMCHALSVSWVVRLLARERGIKLLLGHLGRAASV